MLEFGSLHERGVCVGRRVVIESSCMFGTKSQIRLMIEMASAEYFPFGDSGRVTYHYSFYSSVLKKVF